MRDWKRKKTKTSLPGNNRIIFLMSIVFLLVAVIIGKLAYLQVAKKEHYSSLADRQHKASRKIAPKRGQIFINDAIKSSLGENQLYPIATNKDYATVFVVPKDIESATTAAEALYEIFNKEKVAQEIETEFALRDDKNINERLSDLKLLLTEKEREEKRTQILAAYEWLRSSQEEIDQRNLEKELMIRRKKEELISGYLAVLDKKDDPYELIARKVDDTTLQKVKDLSMKGLSYEMEPYRYYPEGNSGAHILGFVGYGEDRKGYYGLEGFFNEEMTGIYGSETGERGANRKLIILNDRQYSPPKDGSDIILTIDRTIQFIACQKLKEATRRHGADLGTLIVEDPSTGAIIAMCSYPDYDPNDYEDVKEASVFNNPAIFSQYEPGSVMKTMTMAAGINEDKVAPSTTYSDKGSVMIEGWSKPIKNSDFDTKGGHGIVNMSVVLEQSLNTGAIFVQQKLGARTFAQYMKDFGFGEKTGIELETEVEGDIKKLLAKKPKPIDLATASFGQGVMVTPLQMINAYAAIANGGKLMQPYIVKEIRHSDGSKSETQPREIRRVVSERTASLVSAMLVNVLDKGHTKRAKIKGYYVGGKTGTAQVASKGGYSEQYNHTFIGLAPAEDPKFVMLVRMDNPKDVIYADSSAAPLFAEVGQAILDYWQVPKGRKE